MRDLSRELTLNPNTVARAYRCLQDEKIVEAVRGVGLAVTSSAVALCQEQRVTLLRERLRQVLLEARQSRLEPAQLRALVEEELAALEQQET